MTDSDIQIDGTISYGPDINELLAGYTFVGDISDVEDLICKPGYINIDFRDIQTSLSEDKPNYVVTGFGEGPTRVKDAVDAAAAKLPAPITTYKSLIFQLYFDKNTDTPLKVSEAQSLNAWFDTLAKDIRIVWGIAHDDTLASKVKITLIAS